jgi:hypothetical protein
MRKFLFILFLFPALTFAQRNLPLNREWGILNEVHRDAILKDTVPTPVHKYQTLNVEKFVSDPSCFKPYITKSFAPLKDKSRKWIIRKLKYESAVVLKDSADRFNLSVDPLLVFEAGSDLASSGNELLYKNSRGILLRGDIGEKISFESSFYENQATYAAYIDSYIASTDDLFPQTANYNYNVIPGQGRSKPFRSNGYDFSMASGYISYSPSKLFNFQVGHGKHFVGDGYRSLLLSDNAFNYPYARITTTWKNIQYTNLYASFMNLTNGGTVTPAYVERLFQKKTASFQMLSVNLFKRLQLGVFQGMIWEGADTVNSQHLSFNTFNPVIGVNTAVYGLNHENNILLGATMKFKITSSLSLYGQFMLDDVYDSDEGGEVRSKNGWQLGFKYHNLFGAKNLNIQAEYNSARPYSYAAVNTEQSYTHYNQALAHPLGANFNEAIGIVNYLFRDFFLQLKGNYAVKGLDSLNHNYGGNIFRTTGSFPIGQKLDNISTTGGLRTEIINLDMQLGYLVNHATNLNIYVGFTNRIQTINSAASNTQIIYFGLRTSLSNVYYDF